MSGVLVLTCNARGRECQQLRAVEGARSLGAARARAAVHGWSTWERHGVTLDACPVCGAAAALLQVARAPVPVPGPEVSTDRLVELLLDEAARERSPLPRSGHPVRLLPDGAEVCDSCADGEHRRCRGCACPAVDHDAHARMPVRAPAAL